MKPLHFHSAGELAAELAKAEHRGRALHVRVLHDDACTPELCTCAPEFVLEDLTAETLAAGERAEREWIEAATKRGAS